MTFRRRAGLTALLVALVGLAVLLAGIAYATWSTAAEEDERSGGRAALTSGGTTVEGELVPGAAVTGSLVVRNGAARTLEVRSARFEPATTTTRGCSGGVVFALTVEPAAGTPLVLPPARTATPLGWTAFMAADADDDCQGARFTSALVLDGERVGTAVAAAARLAAPGQPRGRRTTPTAAAVQWPGAAAATGYLLQRAPAGTADWVPACGSATTALAAPSCTDTGLDPATAYAYRAVSVRGAWRAVGRLSLDVATSPR